MRQVLFVISFVLIANANSIWWNSNFDKAHHKARKTSKKIMVLLIEKDAKANNNILVNTFMNQDYIDKINEDYISVLITKNQDISYPIELLFTTIYPSVFFLNDLEIYVCEPIRGGLTPERLKTHLDKCK